MTSPTATRSSPSRLRGWLCALLFQTALAVSLSCAFLGLGAGVLAAAPQSGPDSQSLDEVTVTGHKYDRSTLEHHIVPRFVQSHGAISPVISQVGRWHAPVCPQVTGLRKDYGEFVVRRIEEVAQKVGAPTRGVGARCAVNVEVVFTSTPQQLLDHISKDYRWLLGFYQASEAKEVTTISRPVQAWYVTGTRSMNPIQKPAPGLDGGQSGDPTNPAIVPFNDGAQIDAPPGQASGAGGLRVGGTAGSHLGEGLTSELLHAFIIVDSGGVSKHSLGTIADYLAMLSLTRLTSLDTCSELPSIVDILSRLCGDSARAPGITGADIAFLTALYGADLEPKLNVERADMRDRMVRIVEEH